MFAKLHVLVRPHGRLAACRVTPGGRYDSPVFSDARHRSPHRAVGGRIIAKNMLPDTDYGQRPALDKFFKGHGCPTRL